ncbi:MAG: TPM domain-containing protein [Gammaproteobacteria bacterium]
MLRRWLQHLTTTPLALRRRFPPQALAAIEAAITASEREHRAEIRCAIESVLPAGRLLRGVTSAARATEVFARLHVWDTAENNGVLLYVLLAERKIEIVPDRGYAGLVSPAEWAEVCAQLERAFATGEFLGGTVAAIERIGVLAGRHFPAWDGARNELSDRPVLL